MKKVGLRGGTTYIYTYNYVYVYNVYIYIYTGPKWVGSCETYTAHLSTSHFVIC